jgi:hypothetical protein
MEAYMKKYISLFILFTAYSAQGMYFNPTSPVMVNTFRDDILIESHNYKRDEILAIVRERLPARVPTATKDNIINALKKIIADPYTDDINISFLWNSHFHDYSLLWLYKNEYSEKNSPLTIRIIASQHHASEGIDEYFEIPAGNATSTLYKPGIILWTTLGLLTVSTVLYNCLAN